MSVFAFLRGDISSSSRQLQRIVLSSPFNFYFSFFFGGQIRRVRRHVVAYIKDPTYVLGQPKFTFSVLQPFHRQDPDSGLFNAFQQFRH